MSLLISTLYIVFDTAFAAFLTVKKEHLFDISSEETDEAQAIPPYLMLRRADMIWCAVIALLDVLYTVTRFATSLSVPLIGMLTLVCLMITLYDAYYAIPLAEIMAKYSRLKAVAITAGGIIAWSGLIAVPILLFPPNL